MSQSRKIKLFSLLFFIGAPSFLLFLSQKEEAKEDFLVFAINPSQQHMQITENSDTLAACLKEKESLSVKVLIPQNAQTIVQAMSSGKVDAAIITLGPYALIRRDEIGEAHLMVTRKGAESYQGAFYVHRDSNFQSFKDLSQKTFAFPDPNSTSGRVFVLKKLRENEIKIGKTIFTQSAAGVISSVYTKAVDVGGAFWNPDIIDGIPQDARRLVLTQYPDVMEKVLVFKKTDHIPNDPLVLRSSLTENQKKRFLRGLKDCLKEHPDALSSIQATGLVYIRDEHYESSLRALGETILENDKLDFQSNL